MAGKNGLNGQSSAGASGTATPETVSAKANVMRTENAASMFAESRPKSF